MPVPRWPPPPRPGDRVGVAALSGWARPERLERGLRSLRDLGFEPVLAPNIAARDGPFAGSDTERLEGFHRLAADPDIRALFFLRGGHGVLRLLDRIDWELLGAEPRAYVGYSDLTPLLLEITRRTGQVTFHGPMVAVELARGLLAAERRSLLDALGGERPIEYRGDGPTAGEPAEGRLLGGCLSLLSCAMGTDFALRTSGPTVLFWEDVDEPFYRVDRMLTQLRLSDRVCSLSGMVVGRTGLDRDELQRLGGDFGRTFVAGLSSGHCEPNLTLPLGAAVRVDPLAGRIEVAPGR